jgi:hypothetical protein
MGLALQSEVPLLGASGQQGLSPANRWSWSLSIPRLKRMMAS